MSNLKICCGVPHPNEKSVICSVCGSLLNSDKKLSVGEVASRLGVSKGTVYGLVGQGCIKHERNKPGGSIKIRESWYKEYESRIADDSPIRKIN